VDPLGPERLITVIERPQKGPSYELYKPKEDATLLCDSEMTMYQSGVGMLLYLVKYLRPDISNAVQELSKGMKDVTPDVMKELK